MRWRQVIYIVGILLVFVGLFMIIPMAVGLFYKESGAVKALVLSMTITIAVGAVMYAFTHKKGETLTHREGMAIVAFGWAGAGLFGALPFYFGDVFPLYCDATFESVSGFTTTGSSLLSDIEAVPKALLFWRSFIQWLGGMGIIVLSLAILPFLGVGGMQLYKAEVPSPVPDKLTPKVRDTAMLLWKVYALFTVLECIMLVFGGMGLFDAVNHAMTTLPTGGFSTMNTSVGQFGSAYFDWVIIFFMLLAGVNFALHYQLLRGNPKVFWKDPECRVFIILAVVMTFIVTFDIYSLFDSFLEALRYGAFQVVSILTTTGYATYDYEKWSAFSQLLLVVLMFVGGSAGSTGGGIKVLRVILLFKYCYRELFRMVHPRAVAPVKLGGKVVPDDIHTSICGFFILFMGLSVISTLILTLLGVDIITSIGAVAATMGNIGPGIGGVGPMDNFTCIPYVGKWLLIMCMLLGRLEIYTIIILFIPEFWRK